MSQNNLILTKSKLTLKVESQISAFIAIEDLGDDSDDECEEC